MNIPASPPKTPSAATRDIRDATTGKQCRVVDVDDKAVCLAPVEACHRRPLHRAVRVILVDMDGYICMQQRAAWKPTFPLCWSNTVFSHPRDATVDLMEWVRRRCKEEIGYPPSAMRNIGRLHYRARTGVLQDWEEHEMDHVVHVEIDVPQSELPLVLDRKEIESVKWVRPSELRQWMSDDAVLISPWFRAIWRELYTDSDSWPTPKTNVQDVVRVQHEVGHGDVESDHAILTPYSYMSGMTGKQIRPLLTKAVAGMLGLSEHEERTIAQTIQGIHNASLVADDIEDVSKMRRGAPCAHHVYGTALSINAPYFAMFKILQRLEEEPSSVLHHTVDALVELHRGQGTDIQWASLEHCPTQEEYLRMVAGKTGALFRLIATLGCAYAGENQNRNPKNKRGPRGPLLFLGPQKQKRASRPSFVFGNVNLVELYGRMAQFFQIRDDYCNICDEDYWDRKGFFEDLDEGKMSYTVIDSFEKSEEAHGATLRRLLTMRGKASLSEKCDAYEILHRSNSLAYTYAYLNRVKAALKEECKCHAILFKVMERLPIVEPPTVESVRSRFHPAV